MQTGSFAHLLAQASTESWYSGYGSENRSDPTQQAPGPTQQQPDLHVAISEYNRVNMVIFLYPYNFFIFPKITVSLCYDCTSYNLRIISSVFLSLTDYVTLTISAVPGSEAVMTTLIGDVFSTAVPGTVRVEC